MKNILIFLAVCLPFYGLHAQRKYALELNAGLNQMHLPKFDSIGPGQNMKSEPALNFVFNISRNLNPHFSLSLGIGYQKNKITANDFVFSQSHTTQDTFALFDFYTTTESVQLPLLLTYYPLKTKIAEPFVQIGITNHIKFKEKTDYENLRLLKLSPAPLPAMLEEMYYRVSFFPTYFRQTSNFSEIPNKYNMMFTLAVGLKINITQKIFAGFNCNASAPFDKFFKKPFTSVNSLNFLVGFKL